jgi:hypothetical protein
MTDAAQYKAEQARIAKRRERLGLDEHGNLNGRLALALSGGGIRSATFSLGVLQAMARAPAPPIQGQFGRQEIGSTLLPHFDYLSTVSGGGYIGAFFGSLFLPGRWDRQEKPQSDQQVSENAVRQAAERAYKTLRFEPPGRLHSHKDYESGGQVGEASMAWLRENGRYLTPLGAGDMFYALGLTLRNLLAVHYVLGMPLLALLALYASLLNLLEENPLCRASSANWAEVICNHFGWLLPATCLALLTGPLMLAFWLVYARQNQEEHATLLNAASIANLTVAVALGLTAWLLRAHLGNIAWLLGGMALLVLLANGYHFALVMIGRATRIMGSGLEGPDTVKSYRVRVTRWLAFSLIGIPLLGFLPFVQWIADELYCWIIRGNAVALTPFALLSGIVAAVKGLAGLLDDKKLPTWARRIPLEIIAGVAGILMLLSTAVLWGILVEWIRWNGEFPNSSGAATNGLWRLLPTAATATLLMITSALFIGFLNLSSLHSFYSSRLARAYLGASNGLRFANRKSGKHGKPRMSVTDAVMGDDIPLEHYYGPQTCAPLHLINVTMNLTVDPGEQLIQRDRKGKPLCIAPGYYPEQHGMEPISFIYDGTPRQRSKQRRLFSEINQPLSLAHWIATSGAAVSTGLGRATSLGTSLALGLANVRLGIWWPANFLEQGEEPDAPRRWRDKTFARRLPTQTYLFYELTAHFHGHRRDFQYLSDGGHFDNTAAYELLRPERGIELIVLCDNGRDSDYRFDDLANLVRLARIDHSLEIQEDTEIGKVEALAPIFGSTGGITSADSSEKAQRCALLFNVYDKEQPANLRSRILVLKPCLFAGLPLDVSNYARNHPAFPNESTADQFFDEAQFESYRKLGLSIGQLLFGNSGMTTQPAVAQALRDYLWPPQLSKP